MKIAKKIFILFFLLLLLVPIDSVKAVNSISDLTASQISGGQDVLLTWTPPSPDPGWSLSDYILFRDGTSLGSIGSSLSEYTDPNVSLGNHRYSLMVMYFSVGQPPSSDVSNEANINVATIPPPSDLVATQSAPYTVTLNWTGGSSEGYKIYRDGQQIASTNSGITSFEDFHVLTGNRIYQVSSYNPSTNSESGRITTTIMVTGTGTPLDVEICTGGVDEDGDTMTDCADLADCSTDPACAPPPTEICDNGVDDGNSSPLVDCADPACLGDPACTGGGTHRPSGDLFPIIQCGNNCPGAFPGDPNADCCTLCDAFETISRIINIILMFGFILGGMFLVVAGIIMYAGGASSGLLNKSKTIIKGVIFGIVIMLVSYLIVFTIIHFLSAGNADTLFSIKNGGFVIECTP
jgi:hypothetical protein